MDPPSPSLLAALRDLRLAGPRDVRRAARHCRRLACDLPAFDSVWIDALVRTRRLTPFQAVELQEGRAGRLRVGGHVLLDRLGGSRECATFTARLLAGGPTCVLKEIAIPPERRTSVTERLRQLVTTAGELRSPYVIGPREILTDDARIVAVSRFVRGLDARSWLIRRGRLPSAVVVEIARRLMSALAEVHRLGLTHGDLRPVNLRLGNNGEVTLVDLGLRPAITPVVSVHDVRPPEWYEGTAPELIGANSPAAPATDVYALGCLLWHLLAGRAPFPSGDPLGVLAAHLSRPVPDVRDFAPDVPDELAAVIGEMTDLDASRRPTDLAKLRNRLRSPGRNGRTTLRAVGAATSSHDRFPWPAAAAAVFALSGACVFLADLDAASTLLSLRFGRSGIAAASVSADEDASPGFTPLPPPDERGVVTLEHAGPYGAADIVFQGPLVIRGQADRPATIVVTDQPLHLCAEEVTLEHVNVVHEADPAAIVGPPALLLVEAQNLTVRSCRLESSIRPLVERSASPAGIAWRLIDRQDPTAGRITVEDCVSRGVREVLFFAVPPRRIAVSNLLAVGLRTTLSFRECGRTPVEIELAGVTIRDAGVVVGVGRSDGKYGVRVSARQCILDLAGRSALFAAPEAAHRRRLEWQGMGVVTTGGVQPLAVAGMAEAENAADPSSAGVEVSGIAPATIEFAGPAHGSDAASVATVRGVPRQAGQPLGVDLARLPKPVSVSTE